MLPEIRDILSGPGEPTDRLLAVCQLLRHKVDHYDWVGFYLVAPDNAQELVLGPYDGEATDHVRIPFGRGICGQAAEREATFIVDDVSAEGNYLSCSVSVRSEIVLPVFRDGRLVGELDIDSHTPKAFTEVDRALLEEVCRLAGPLV